MTKQELIEKIRTLNQQELTFVCGRLEEYLNQAEPPVISEEESALRQRENKELIEEVKRDLEIEPAKDLAETDAVLLLLETVIEYGSPDYQAPIAEALEELKHKDVKLDFGLSLALGIIIPAIAVAIIRPRLKYHDKKDGKKSEKKLEIEVWGIPEIDKVVKAVLPFMQ
jgi:hypothetical protein